MTSPPRNDEDRPPEIGERSSHKTRRRANQQVRALAGELLDDERTAELWDEEFETFEPLPRPRRARR